MFEKDKFDILDEIWYQSLEIPADIALEGELGDYYEKYIATSKNNLLETLSEEQKKLFSEYEEAMNFWHDRVERENFKCGFKIGARIAHKLEH